MAGQGGCHHILQPKYTVMEVIMGKEQFRFIWERAMTLQPDIQPTTKHVLLTLAVFMDEKATCFPSVSLLSERTGLSRRCVCEHFEKAALE